MLAILSRFFVDLLWFDSLGFRAVFTAVWLTMIVVFAIASVLSSGLLLLSGFIAARATAAGSAGRRGFRVVGRNAEGLPGLIWFSLDKVPWWLIIPAVALIIGLFIGVAQTGNWETILKWIYAAPFGRPDPLFGHDLGFYVFSLPVYELFRDWGTTIIFWSAVLALSIYWLRGDIIYQPAGFPSLSPAAIRHLSALLAVYFLIKAAGTILDRYDLLTSNNGVVFGAAYTDVRLRLPLLMSLAAASLLAAALCAFYTSSSSISMSFISLSLFFAVSLIQRVLPGFF